MRSRWTCCLFVAIGVAAILSTPLEARDDDDDETVACVRGFEASIREGPHAGHVRQGILALSIGENGSIDRGAFAIQDGPIIDVVGQTRGRAINLFFEHPVGNIFGVGTGANDIRACAGPVGGPAVGPTPGDSGDWASCCLLDPVVCLDCLAGAPEDI